jgi:large subunit ribosomal protein L17
MRHGKHGKKLGRLSAHRHALWSNMVSSLIEHERVETTDVKAKELRRIAERTITWSTQLGDLLTRDAEKLDAADKARKVHAIRMARRVLKDPATLRKLFEDVGPRFLGRPGGYTRVLKVRNRHGDAAPMSIVELVERGAAEVEEPEEKDAKGGAKKAKAKAAPAEGVEAAAKPAKKRAPKKAADEGAEAEKKPAKKKKKDEE